jgi:hypothetical protein
VQTPGHAAINLSLISAVGGSGPALPILLGAILPDVPIVVLYLREHYLHHLPEEVIWREHYQRPFWQNLIHGMHSFPLGAAGLALSLTLHSVFGAYFFGSALLHALGDLPIHVEDAHRHFWPLSNYRFISSISYWDLRYHAREVAAVELACVAAACAWLWFHLPGPIIHALLFAVVAWYGWSYRQLWRSKPVDPRARAT